MAATRLSRALLAKQQHCPCGKRGAEGGGDKEELLSPLLQVGYCRCWCNYPSALFEAALYCELGYFYSSRQIDRQTDSGVEQWDSQWPKFLSGGFKEELADRYTWSSTAAPAASSSPAS